jgi:UDP-glucose 4-epimerase
LRIIITGSSGRIGRSIHELLSRQHDVIGIDQIPSRTADRVGDILDCALMRDVLVGADAIIHVAARHSPHVGHVSEAEFRLINVFGTSQIIQAARAARVSRIVFTSTTALYGYAATPKACAGWVDESLDPKPRTIYHQTKLEAERLLRSAALTGGPTVRILRISRCFPEPAPLMAMYRLHRGIDTRDVAKAHALSITHDGAAEATFVISGATPFRKLDTTRLLFAADDVIRERSPALAQEFSRRGWTLPKTIDRVYDASAAGASLNWRPDHGAFSVLAMYDRGDIDAVER